MKMKNWKELQPVIKFYLTWKLELISAHALSFPWSSEKNESSDWNFQRSEYERSEIMNLLSAYLFQIRNLKFKI